MKLFGFIFFPQVGINSFKVFMAYKDVFMLRFPYFYHFSSLWLITHY